VQFVYAKSISRKTKDNQQRKVWKIIFPLALPNNYTLPILNWASYFDYR